MSIDNLGIGELNRGISYKYAHALASQVVLEKGFNSLRYKVCIAVKPNSKDPLASTRRTNKEAAASAGKLPFVDPERPRNHLLTKNHLFLVLLILTDGRIPRD